MLPDDNRGEEMNPMDDFEELTEALEDYLDAKKRRREKAMEAREENKAQKTPPVDDETIDWNRFRYRPMNQDILRLRRTDSAFDIDLKVAWINYVAARQAAIVEFNRSVEVAWVAANQREVKASAEENPF